MRLIHFIFSRSIFVSLCAAFLCVQTFILTKVQLQMSIVTLVFFATLFFYNFYAILIRWQSDIVHNKIIVLEKYAANFSLLLFAVVFILDGLIKHPNLLAFIWVPTATSGLYVLLRINNIYLVFLKKLGFFKTILLSFTWAYMTVILPVLYAQNSLSELVINVFFIRFIFMLMLGVIFDFRDVQKDKKNNMSSVTTMFNKSQLIVLMMILLLLNALLCYWNLKNLEDVQQFILMISTVLCFLFFTISFKKRDYYFYYFLVDGLMLISAMASIIATL